MNLERFLADASPRWTELEGLLSRAGATGAPLTAAELRCLGALYRSAAADLALARRSFPDTEGALRLQALVGRANGIVYAHARRDQSAGAFFSRVLWQQIRSTLGTVGLAAAVMLGATVLGALWAVVEPGAASGLVPGGAPVQGHGFHGAFYGIPLSARGGLAVAIFVNNIFVSFLAVAGGFTFGLLTAYALVFNGALLGVLGALEWRAGGLSDFLRLVLPHGLLELSCVALAGGAGLAIARALVDPGRDTRAQALGRLVPVLGACVLGTIVFLVVAGLTEGFITPWDLPTSAAVSVGVVLAGGFWTAVAVRGRSPAASQPRPLLEAQIGLHAG